MGDISKHFNRSEFACKDHCGLDTVDTELLIVLEQVREHFNKPIKITSACRCFEHNLAVGGSIDSQHTKCRAADIQVRDASADEVHAYINSLYPNQFGLGSYSNFTHIDTRSYRVRW